MKKVLDVDADVEKVLSVVFDAALKQSGMQMYGAINQLISSIKQSEENE
jgi:hypothetical protein